MLIKAEESFNVSYLHNIGRDNINELSSSSSCSISELA